MENFDVIKISINKQAVFNTAHDLLKINPNIPFKEHLQISWKRAFKMFTIFRMSGIPSEYIVIQKIS
jgi:hypothetical protein